MRRALAVLELKGVAYEIDPIVPFLGDDRFSRVSPLRRVPVLIDDAAEEPRITRITRIPPPRNPRAPR